jgi:hypothetical protein
LAFPLSCPFSLCRSVFLFYKKKTFIRPTKQQKQKTKTKIKTTTTALSVSPTLPISQEKTHQKSNYIQQQQQQQQKHYRTTTTQKHRKKPNKQTDKNLMISFVLKSFFRFQISSVKKLLENLNFSIANFETLEKPRSKKTPEDIKSIKQSHITTPQEQERRYVMVIVLFPAGRLTSGTVSRVIRRP